LYPAHTSRHADTSSFFSNCAWIVSSSKEKESLMTWGAVIALSVGSYLFKLLGVITGQRFSKYLAPGTALLPAALFSALIIIMSVSDDGSLVIDARLVGVGIGGLAVWKKMPFTLVVLLAMFSTAVIRLIV
jgi:hypothetical protein